MLFFFSEELREHFGKYGEIESITVKMDPQTGRSRGFAFLVFKTAENLDKVNKHKAYRSSSKFFKSCISIF